MEDLDAVIVRIRVALDQAELFQGADLPADRGLVEHVVRRQVGRAAALLVVDVRQQRVGDQGQLRVEPGRRCSRTACEGGQFALDDIQRFLAFFGGAWHGLAFLESSVV